MPNPQTSTSSPRPTRGGGRWRCGLLLALVTLAGACSNPGDTTPRDPDEPTGSSALVFVEETLRSTEHPAYQAVDCAAPRTLTLQDNVRITEPDPRITVTDSPAALTLPAGDGAYEIGIEYADTGETTTVKLRCLPEHFPTIELDGELSSWVALTTMSTEPGRPGYRIILDRSGFPVWFAETAGALADFTVTDGRLLTFTSGHRPVESFTNLPGKGFHLETFAGEEIARWVPATGDGLDNHAVALLPNGNILGLLYELSAEPLSSDRSFPGAPQQRVERCPDATPRKTDRTLRGRIVEIDPQGRRVHTWAYEEHVAAPASSPEWINIGTPDTSACVIDIEHLNGLAYYPETDGTGRVLLTGRHVDGAVMLAWPSGEVLWRIGGTPGADSLRIEDDPHGGPQHPHDANLIDDQTLLIYDNRAQGEPSRALLYRIDLAARRATLLETYGTDCPDGPCAAFAMGSARPTANGTRILVGWGTNAVTASEFERGQVGAVAELRLGATWAYRVLPVADGDHDALFAVARNR